MKKTEVLKKVSPRDYQLIERVMNSGVYCGNSWCMRRHYPGRGYQCPSCWRAAREAVRVIRSNIA